MKCFAPSLSPGVRRFTIFALVGAFGFAVDAGVLSILAWNGVNIYLARFFSFGIASAATWFLNRKLTFQTAHSNQPTKEYGRYVAVQAIGGALNMGVFTGVVMQWPLLSSQPIVPLAFGAIAGLLFNFIASRNYVFDSKAL